MLDGKIGKDGFYTPGVINTILGRKLECGEYSWYRKVWTYFREYAWYDFKTKVFGWDWYAEKHPIGEEGYGDGYDFKSGLSRRQAHRLAMEWVNDATRTKTDADIWAHRDRVGPHKGLDIEVRNE